MEHEHGGDDDHKTSDKIEIPDYVFKLCVLIFCKFLFRFPFPSLLPWTSFNY